MGVGAGERQSEEGSFQSCSHGKCFYFLLERKWQRRIKKKKKRGGREVNRETHIVCVYACTRVRETDTEVLGA